MTQPTPQDDTPSPASAADPAGATGRVARAASGVGVGTGRHGGMAVGADAAEPGGRMDARVGRLGERAGAVTGRLAPWVLGAAVALASLATMESYLQMLFPVPGRQPALWFQALVVAFCLGSGVAAGVARRWRLPLYVMAAVGWAWLALWPAVIAAAYYAGTRLRRWTHLLAFGAATVAVTVVSIVVSVALGGVRAITTGTFPNVVILLAGIVGLPLALGRWVSARRRAAAALRDRAARLEREQHARTEQARAQERTRIAREMHDVVAHRVSLMVLHAGGLEVGATDPRTVETAALIRGIGRDALTDLRDVLGVLRSPGPDGAAAAASAPQPTLADLDGLLDQSRRLGVTITRRDDGEPRPLSAIVERTVYRIVQEALTNVHKHAADAVTEVALRYSPAHLEVAVHNAAPRASPADPPPGAGLGLNGIRERAELLGGTLEAGRAPDGGFSVRASLPTDTDGGSR